MKGRKGQGGLEFLMTYGWVMLVIMVVFVVVWQWGLFSFSSRIEPRDFGFWGVVPQDYVMHSNGNFEVSFLNTVGASITLLHANSRTAAHDRIDVDISHPPPCAL